MLEWWNQLSLSVFDALLGWLLGLPSDVALFAVAIGSALILTLVRLVTTDQDLLRRASADKKRLRQLIRQAKRAGDKNALRRHRATSSMIALKTFTAEGLPLLASILPIAMLATWCIHRLEFHPPADGETVRVAFYAPVSAIGGVAHIVPQDGLSVSEGYVRPIEAGEYNNQPEGVATWTLRAKASDQPYRLLFRYRGQTFEQELRVGQRIYSPPAQYHGDYSFASTLGMRPLKLFNVVPGIEAIAFPPWLVAYLIIVIPFVFIVKRALRIY